MVEEETVVHRTTLGVQEPQYRRKQFDEKRRRGEIVDGGQAASGWEGRKPDVDSSNPDVDSKKPEVDAGT